MADNRKIIHGVVVGDKTITDPDELAEVMTPEMQKRFEAAGSIEGNWKAKGKDKGGLSSMTLADLRTAAADKGIAGASSMKKAELLEALGEKE